MFISAFILERVYALRLDKGAARMLETAGALLRLGGEMMVHASTLEV